MDEKPFWVSKTLWGAVMMIVALVLTIGFGVELPDNWKVDATNNIVAVATGVSGLVGLVLVFVGRLKAKTKLTTKKVVT